MKGGGWDKGRQEMVSLGSTWRYLCVLGASGSPDSAGKAWRRAWAASKEGGTGLLGLRKTEKKKL